MKIDIDATGQWDLVLTIRKVDYATRKPTWAQVRALASIEQALTAGDGGEGLEAKLRQAVAPFFAEPLAAVVADLDYDELMAILVAASTHFSAWLAGKQAAARQAALGSAANEPAPPARAADRATPPGKSSR